MDLYSYYELTPAQRDAVLGQGYVPDKPAPKPEKVTKYDAKTNAILNMPPEKTNAYVKALQNSLRGQQAAQNEIISGIKKGQEVPQGFIGNILDVGTGELRGLAEAAKIPVTVSKAGMELYNQYLPEDLKSLMHTQERINDANKALQDIESFKNKNLPYTHEASLEHFMQAPSLNEGVALTTHLVGENLPALVAGGYAGKIAGGLAAGAGAAEKGVEAATRIGNVAAFTPFEAAPTYNQMREQGVDPTKAAIASIGYAVPSSMVESYLGEVPLANKIIGESGAKDIGKTLSQKIAKTVTGIIKTGLGEGSENGIQQVMRNIADNAVGIQTDIFKDVPSSVVGGTLGGLGIGVPGNIMLQAKSASVQDRTATKENLNKQNKILNESINHIENDQEATPEEKTKAKENIVKIVNDNQNKIDAINQVESNEAVASQPVESQPESLGNYYDKKQELQGYINNTNSIISNYENDPTFTEEEKAVARETHNQIIDNTQLQIDEINEHLLKNEKPEIIQSEEFKKNHPDVYSLYEESLVPESVTTVEQPIIEELPKPNLEGTVTENVQPEAIVEEPTVQNNQTVKEPTYEELSNNDNYTELKTNYKNIDAANKIATSLRNKSSNNDYIITSKDDKFAIFKTPKQVETQHVEENIQSEELPQSIEETNKYEKEFKFNDDGLYENIDAFITNHPEYIKSLSNEEKEIKYSELEERFKNLYPKEIKIKTDQYYKEEAKKSKAEQLRQKAKERSSNKQKAKKKEVKSNDKENIPGISSNQRERESTKQTESNKTTSREETSTSGVLQTQNEKINKEVPIPIDLKNSKPRYKLHELKFNNFVDLALYTVRNRSTESKRHNDFMNYLKKVFPQKTESDIRSLGDNVLNRIKVLESASMNDKEVLTIEEETPPKGRSEKGQSLNPIEALANVVDAVVNPAINLAKTSYNNLNTWVLAKGKKMPYGGIQDKNMRWVDFKRDIALIDHFIDPESAVWKYSKIASKAMSILKQANIVISNNTYRTQQELEKIKIDAKKNNIDDVTIIDVMENKTTSTNPIVNDLASRLKTMLKSMKTKVINELVDSKRISPDIKYTLSNADYESLSATLFNKGIMNSKKSNYSTNYLKSHPEIILTNIPNNSLAQKLAAGKYTLNYDNYNITMQGDSTTKLIENFKQELESKWGIEDYFPHMWRGQFAVRNVTDIDPENHFIENFCESPKDFQERVLPALQAKYGNSIKQMEFEIAPKQISMDTNSTNLNRKLWMMLVDKTAKLGNIERSEMASMMKALNIKIQYDIKGKSDMNLTSQREKDLDTYIKTLDTLNVYFAQAERFVELNKAIREVTPMIEKIDKDQPQLKQFVKNYINALKGTWTDLDRIVNNQLTRIGMSKRDITNIENALLTYNYHALLGGFIFNLSSPLANLTQNVNTYALTGEKAFGQALKNITTNEGKAIIQDLYDRNILTIEDFKFNAETFTHSVENPTLKFLGQLNTTLFQLAEKVNRSMAALAFHYDGIEKGLTGKSLDEHIRIGVQSTQFDNTVSGQPLISRMGVPRLITQFKGFLCKTLNLSFGLYNDTLKAYQSGNKTLAKEKLKESIRFTLGYLAVGGPMAIAPMAVLNTSLGILGSLLNILGVNPEDTVDDVGWTALMQNWFTEAASKGLLGFLGIDISPSVQIMIPSTPKDFLGPTLGPIITSALQGNKNLKDAIADVSENFTPNNVLALARLGNIRALNNIIDAYFAQTTGSFLSKKMKQEYDVITFLQKVASPKTLMHIKETQPYVYKKIMDGTINDVNTYKVITTAFGLRPLSRNSNIQTWLDIKKYDDTVKTKGLARKQHIIELRTQALKAKEEGNIKEYDKKLEESKKLKDQTIKEGYYTKTGLTTSVKTEAKKNLNPIKAEEKQIKSIFKKENKAKRAMSK